VCALPEPYRAAVYYAPEVSDPLWTRGCAWLGRDPERGEAVEPPSVFDLAALTSSPRRYGFHATLKPPMRLAGTFAAFLADVRALAATLQPFALPTLGVVALGRFIALCPVEPSDALQALADACVMRLDAHRRPESDAEQAKRGIGRSASQLRNIARWGYPLVLEDWRFHMTLSNPLEDHRLALAAQTHFAEALAMPRRVESLAVFIEPEPGADFRLAHRVRLAG
jgi:hypothetical protein